MGAVLTFLSTLFVFSVVNGTPLLYGTLGEILTEKSGNMNLGVEGILFMGGAAGLGGAFYYEKLAGANASPFVALLLAVFFAFLAGALASLLFSFITITLRANQNVTGLALTIFGIGAGLLVVFIRYFGGYPEGVCYSILIMNICVWLIDKATLPKRFGVTAEMRKAEKEKAKAAKKAAKEGAEA